MTNPLLADSWDTPFGLPPYDRIEDRHYMPALLEGMRQQKVEVEAIASNPDAPTFENTVEALERTGALLDRVASAFYSKNSAHTTDEMQKVAREAAPLLAAHADDIGMNRMLFERIQQLFEVRVSLGLDHEQMRLLTETHLGFVRSGIHLPKKIQGRIREINGRLSELSTRFGDHLLAETNDYGLMISDAEELEPLPDSLVAMAADEAKRRGQEGRHCFTLRQPSVIPFLQYSTNRGLRRQLFEAYARLGDNDNAWDNKQVLAAIAELRAERAALMGYPSHSHYVLEKSMAQKPEHVYALLDQIWKPAIDAARREARDLEKRMNEEGVDGSLEAADWRFYTERLRKQRFDLDDEALRPYFEVNAVRDGAFDVVKRLFGLSFLKRDDVSVWHEDQQAFEVRDADGSHLGVLLLDLFARASKRGGAWENTLRAQSNVGGRVRALATVNTNFPAPTPDGPSLLRFTEANTLFHELGHALHDLLSDVAYESLSGTNVRRDYVEFPSQVLENWLSEPEVLSRFARHYETGDPIPKELVEKLELSEKFNQGFATVEYLAAAYLDMKWHSLEHGKARINDVRRFETDAMQELGLLPEILPRYRGMHFRHVFAGGYSSGYYSYLWAEVLDADAFEAFRETDLFDPEIARRLRRLLSRGGTRPGDELYREFRGRDPEIAPLIARRGFGTESR